MKIGDKVKVTYSDGDQFLGVIVGETAKQWKVDFDGTGEKRVSKTMQIELVDNPKTPEKEVISRPANVDKMLEDHKKKQARSINWRMSLIIGVTVLLVATAILVGLGYLNLGAEGIYFSF